MNTPKQENIYSLPAPERYGYLIRTVADT